MHGRLFRTLLPISLGVAFGSCTFVAAATSSRCRCLSGQPCWPSSQTFARLATQVSQPLVYPAPPARPCYICPHSSECNDVMNGWTDAIWRSDHAGAMQSPNFEMFIFPNGTIDARYLTVSLDAPCAQESVPEIGVDARSAGDIQAAVRFAAEHNLKLVVKNTGHDFLGRSDGRGSFMVWTHHMKNITVHPSFTPLGALPDEQYEYAMTLDAGVQWYEAYAAADAANRTLVGGISAGGSVGAAGGWLLGGGHSALSPSYGLGVDNVLEISVVTSSGAHLTTNAHRHADLFWALRGGGGGTFGIVTSVTYRTRPSVPVVAVYCLTDAGWGGYTQFGQSDGAYSFAFFGIIPNVSWAQANTTVNPYLKFVEEVAANSSTSGDPAEELTVYAAMTVPVPSWYEWAQVSGSTVEIGSWLIPRDAIETNHKDVTSALLSIPIANYHIIAGRAVSNVSTSAAGLNPAWRKAAAHAVTGISWPDGTAANVINAMREKLKINTATLRALTPDLGAYFNEASLYEPDPAHLFFGSHYKALQAIKEKYDPTDLFIIAEGVGSDHWDKALECRMARS
ncbi:FAD-binding domain-containing protein [Daedaleopsis nitida]|nr:FAD-binding domain-containing protein [Daedaleopsis nitida]